MGSTLCLCHWPRMAALYCVFAVPDLVANSLLHPVRIYLRCNGSIRQLMWCTTLAVLIHIPLAILLAFYLRLGVAGVAIAGFCTNFNTILFLLFYMTEAKSATRIGSLPSRSSLTAAPPPFEAGATNAGINLLPPLEVLLSLLWKKKVLLKFEEETGRALGSHNLTGATYARSGDVVN